MILPPAGQMGDYHPAMPTVLNLSCHPDRYGEEVARLTQANLIVKNGYEIARRNVVAPAVLQDIKVQCPFSRVTPLWS